MIEGKNITPNYYINQLAQNYIKGDYVVMAHIRPQVAENGVISYKTTYKYFGIDEHPIINDLETLVKHCTPSANYTLDNKYGFENGEEILSKLNYMNLYYLEYLIILATRLELIKDIPNKKNRCITAINNDEFNNLSNKDKLSKIVEESIEISYFMFNSMCNLPNKLRKTDIIKMLNNAWTEEQYKEQSDKNNAHMNKLAKEAIGNEELNEEELNIIDGLGDEAINIATFQCYSMFIDMCFTCIFGYYLNIINPVYSEIYSVIDVIEEIDVSEDMMEFLSNVFEADSVHNLSPLGTVVMKEFIKRFKENTFEVYSNSELDKMMNKITANMKKINNRQITNRSAIDEFLDLIGLDEGEEEDIFDMDDKFSEMLSESLGLNEGYEEDYEEENFGEDERKIHLEKHMENFYIEHIATSKTDLTTQLTSLKYYSEFLYNEDIFTPEVLKEAKDVLSNKEYYIELYYNYCNQLEGDFDIF